MSMPVAEGMVVVLVGDGPAWNGGGKGRPSGLVLCLVLSGGVNSFL